MDCYSGDIIHHVDSGQTRPRVTGHPQCRGRYSRRAGNDLARGLLGTAEIACPPLRVLAGMPEIELAAVYTQPDRPRGRGQSVRFSPVKKLALIRGCRFYSLNP